MLRIGLTGGIGSGKSTVAKIFEVLGISVYYADDRAKILMNESPALREQIIHHFGPESYLDNILNRPHLAAIAFSDPEKTKLLNSIVHPVTIADAEEWMAMQITPYAIKEAALIFEANADKQLDLVIGVHAPFELRMQRAMQRDNISEALVQSRMSRQMNEEEKMNRCDFVINNDEKELLTPQVIKIHEDLLRNIERLHN
jgi:dephospho-CoA kinase